MDTEGHDAAVLAGMRQSLRGRRVRVLEFEYSANWPEETKECRRSPDTCKTRRRTLGRTLRWMWEEAGYACFFTGAEAGAMIPISAPCWRPALDVRRWSDILCAHRPDDIAVLRNLSASAFAQRQMKRHGTRRPAMASAMERHAV
eukprot:6747291-Prymnesium_polylepis.1